ncbi:hypothetical protein BN19_024 [Streptococcus phage SP-QS1]|uniref:Uncharacterized protein n=1 Tax=Streptococcus phage SP-QS1 TaxID=1208587 RepID=S6CR08_9CAUD|nr:hypothetical protein BN19_024 [Streptococcus phage SP-QS1]QBZ69237.1 hypothetical protein [Enterococcus phage vB_EfaS_Ef2.2]QBZ69427.1 hypothetical protein [Enterococcus phage vB_EfaS_Ef7.1]CCJ09678.1 hypothetical protein BN19_024 [Streptococcus phage SP-QS1]
MHNFYKAVSKATGRSPLGCEETSERLSTILYAIALLKPKDLTVLKFK